MVADSIDTAFTDFRSHEKFQVEYAGEHWSDSDAEFACIKRALDNGVPFLDGNYLARITRAELNKVFEGNIQMPMLDEKLEVLHQVGKVLAEKYNGRFHTFVNSCSPKLYDNGNGLIDRLVTEFPRFNDVSMLDGHEIKFYKLAQLGVWMLYATLHRDGEVSPGRSAKNDGVRGLHRARSSTASWDHQLFRQTGNSHQFPSTDSAGFALGNRDSGTLHLRHSGADGGDQQAPSGRFASDHSAD